MKIGILGASNTVMKSSWVEILERHMDVEKCAAGSSGSALGVYKFVEKNFSSAKNFYVLNFGVSEHLEFLTGVVDPSHISQGVESLYGLMGGSPHNAITVFFPLQEFYDGKPDLSYDIHRYQAEKNNVIMIDGYLFVRELLRHLSYVGYRSLFRDQYHLSPVLARYMGYAVVEMIRILSGKSKVACGERPEIKYYVVSGDDIELSNLRKVDVENSEFRERISVLERGKQVVVSGKGEIHGLYIDCNNSRSKVKITGSGGTVIKNLYCPPGVIPRGKSIFKFVTLKKPLSFDGELIIENVDDEHSVTEATRDERNLSDNVCETWICGLLLSKGESVVPVYALSEYNSLQEQANEVLSFYAMQCAQALSFFIKNPIDYYEKIEGQNKEVDDYVRVSEYLFKGLGRQDVSECIRSESVRRGLGTMVLDDEGFIKKSGLFDVEYYLGMYGDVKRAGVDPLRHYCTNGYREGRNPSSKFNTSKYSSEKNLPKDVNPLLHYLVNDLKLSRRGDAV